MNMKDSYDSSLERYLEIKKLPAEYRLPALRKLESAVESRVKVRNSILLFQVNKDKNQPLNSLCQKKINHNAQIVDIGHK
jgi:hypothetical protein